MKRTQVLPTTDYFCGLVLCCLGTIALAGCNPGGTPSLESPTPVATSPPVIPPVAGPHVYVVVDYPEAPAHVLAFPQTASRWAPTTLESPGYQVSLDNEGNVYVLSASNSSIDVYSADAPTGPPIRSLPVGSGKKITAVVDVVASPTGEIFVSDGIGIAVFGPSATGNDDPVRYIEGVTQPGGGPSTAIIPNLIAVDSSDNLYVEDVLHSSIVVFGPTDNGTVVPGRTIAGPLTRLDVSTSYILGLATDPPGNLYVCCVSSKTDGSGLHDFAVFEFGPSANGNVAPIKFFTSPEMGPRSGDNGIAVDSTGTIYISAYTTSGTLAVFEFSNSPSGIVTPFNTVTLGLLDSPTSRIAVH